MPRLLTAQSDGTCPLDSETTKRVLARAVEKRARIDLHAANPCVDVACCSTIVGWEGSHLALEPENVDPLARAILTSSQLQAGMEIDDARYVFETRCVVPPAESQQGVIHVLKPTTIALAERRRSPRRRLRRPTDVVLHGTGANDGWHCQAALLNLSPDGLACRLQESARERSEPLETGQTLRVAFNLGVSFPAFDLNARIANLTRGGTPDHLILGLEFIADQGTEVNRPRLRDALKMSEMANNQ